MRRILTLTLLVGAACCLLAAGCGSAGTSSGEDDLLGAWVNYDENVLWEFQAEGKMLSKRYEGGDLRYWVDGDLLTVKDVNPSDDYGVEEDYRFKVEGDVLTVTAVETGDTLVLTRFTGWPEELLE